MTDTVTVLHSAQGAANAIMALGVARGCFERRGVSLVMREVARTGQAVEAMLLGEAEFAVAGSLPVLNAARAGLDPIIILSIEAQNVFGVIGAPGVTTADALRGRRVAISGQREQDDLVMRRTLRDWGLQIGRDVELDVRGSRGRCFQAVLSGECAAMTATIPQPILARRLGLPILKDYAEGHEDFQLGSVVTSRARAQAEPELTARVLAGQIEAIKLFRDDFSAALPHLQARSKLNDIEVLRLTHEIFAEEGDDYVPRPSALRSVALLAASIFGESFEIDIDGIVEPRYALAAQVLG